MEAVTARPYPVVEELEKWFNNLQDVTDQVALINSKYDSKLESAFEVMEGLSTEARTWDPETMDSDYRKQYLSHMSFHREIVAEIISEARRLLMKDRRELLKRLVAYHKDFARWYARVEKKYL